MAGFRLRKFIRYAVRNTLKPDTVRNNGVKLHVNFPVITADIRRCLYEGGWEYEESVLIRRMLRADDRVLEIGGGVGMTGCICAQVCGSGNVVSYEPVQELRPLILANHRANGVQVELRSRAVSADGRTLRFFQTENIMSSSFSPRMLPGRWTTVRSDAINDVLKELQPGFLVIDAEGMEAEILEAARLDNIRCIVVEIHRNVLEEKKAEALVRSICCRGFTQATGKGANVVFLRSP